MKLLRQRAAVLDMPELPEVETVCNGIRPYLEGASIVASKVLNPKLRINIPASFTKLIKGKQILQVKRKAKYILIYLEGDLVIIVHLGMSGRLTVSGEELGLDYYHKQKLCQKHDHVLIELSNGKLLVYNDTRKFGIVTVLRASELHEFRFFRKLGLEPLSEEFSAKVLYEILKARNKSIKFVIMDSSIIVGVGNIYACESLFSAGISPLRIANEVIQKEAVKLYKAIVNTLQRAIAAGGSTISDYAKADGEAGYFQHEFLVYDREGEPCKKCKTMISRIKQNGRSSYYCGSCQK